MSSSRLAQLLHAPLPETPTLLTVAPDELLAEGFHAAINRAALQHLPIVIVIDNRGTACGKPLPMAFANPCLIDLAPAYRLRGTRVTEAQREQAIETGIAVCAAGHGPFIIECLIQE